MAKHIVVDPVTRIEGHLKIEAVVDNGVVKEARSSGMLWRGIEQILQGRDPVDAQRITQRICGVCPTGHSTASTLNLDSAFGVDDKIPDNGRIVRNLILGSNYLQSHILHFYHLAALDYVYQRWQHEQDLKMTKQEVKDEHKLTYGDPKVKARIRSVQMEMARRRMMEAVPEADVVITNPTHLAIALKFDAREMIAPRVLAKGSGHIAQRIREIAVKHQIPLVEEKPLAQALFKMVDIGEYIPVELYRAVAEVLAYVYRLKGMYAR